MTRTHRRLGGSAIFAAAAAVGLAACGGGSSSPHVASLGSGNGSSRGSTTTAPKASNPTQLMDEWATCMHSNGDPNQTDPTIDQYGVINITMPQGVSQTISSEVHGSTGPCSQYELAAENALRAADPVPPPPNGTELAQYVNCMRANGVPNYPNSGPNGETNFNGTGVDPNSPFVENASKVCGEKLKFPAWWIAGTGPPGDVVVTSAGLTPGARPPSNAGVHGGSGATEVPVTNG